MTAKAWFLLLRIVLLTAVAIGLFAFLGFEKGVWLLLAVAASLALLGLGPNYFQPNSDD